MHHLLDVLERVDRETPIAPLRWSIAHLNDATPEEPSPDEGARGRLGHMQNAMFFNGEAFLKARGSEAMRLTPPIMTALKLGIPIGGGTDAHRVMSYNPFVSLQWMVDGRTVGGTLTRDEEQLPTREEALQFYTLGSAWFTFDDDTRGSLKAGKLADSAVLTKDYLTAPNERGRPHRVGADHGGWADRLRRRPVREVGGKAPVAWASRGSGVGVPVGAGLNPRRSRTARRRKPARLQPGKFAIAAQSGQRAIHRRAQTVVVLGKGDAELLVRRHLHRNRQLRTVLHQPGDHRKELDHETNASGLEVVERDPDFVIGVVFDPRNRAFRQEASGDEIRGIAGLDASDEAAQALTDETSGVNRRFTATP